MENPIRVFQPINAKRYIETKTVVVDCTVRRECALMWTTRIYKKIGGETFLASNTCWNVTLYARWWWCLSARVQWTILCTDGAYCASVCYEHVYVECFIFPLSIWQQTLQRLRKLNRFVWKLNVYVLNTQSIHRFDILATLLSPVNWCLCNWWMWT